MTGRQKQLAPIPIAWSRAAIVANASLFLCGLLPAQNARHDLSGPLLQAPDHSDVRQQKPLPPLSADGPGQLGRAVAGDPSPADSPSLSAIEAPHRMVSAARVQAAGYAAGNTELFLTKAKFEVEMFHADLECRGALAGLEALMRER